jgi:sirohydrochlorin ferrochelatase
LRQLAALQLDPTVAARVQRRLQRSPMVLVVHGRQGGDIPSAYGELAEELSRRRRAPVVLQALTAAPPSVDGSFWSQALRAGALTVVPLLLLPGEHVRRDVPQLAAAWGQAAAAALPEGPRPALRRIPFLGAWPQWQRQLADQLNHLAAGRPWCWVHHPLQGALAQRYLAHLGRRLGRAGVAAAEADQSLELPPLPGTSALVVPLALAPNRMAEALKMGASVPQGCEVLSPLLSLSAMRSVLLDRLEAEP